MLTTKNVSSRSTKQDLWNAYSELIEKVAGQPIKLPAAEHTIDAPQFMRQIADLKLSLSKELDKIGEEIIGQSEVLQNIKSTMAKDKQRALTDLTSQKTMLEEEIKKVKESWTQEKKIMESQRSDELRIKSLERKKEEDEYQYQLMIKRRASADEFQQKLSSRQKELDEKWSELHTRKNEIAKMEKELTELPQKIETAVQAAKNELSKQLAGEHQRKLYELSLSHKSEMDIAKLKFEDADKTIKAQVAEIAELKRQLETAARQLKEIAVSVIDSRKPLAQGE